MKLHDKKWTIKNNEEVNLDSLELTGIVKQILVNRGFSDLESINKFLNPDLNDLYDPFLLKDMDKVISRINKAIEKDESIWIYGDYDVDGITSISVFKKCFELLDKKLNYYIPNRLEEGYGLSEYGLNKIIEKGADLIISVDCGITSVKEVEFVKSKGVDIIITDHHNCQEELPDAFAIVNPKQEGCKYPFDMLAGVGIAMKIVQALLGEDFILNYEKFIDITALGTIADIAPIVDENRIITKIGLKVIENTSNIGLRALLEVSDMKNKPVTAGTIGFKLGPKINAAGRIGKPGLGVELLISNSEDEAMKIANELHELNIERQNIEKVILEDIEALIIEQVDLENDKIFVVIGDGWHTGVIGIVASRISEKYFRPSVVLSKDGDVAKGSARSVGDISIFDALNSCKDLFIGFGGHKQAAGLSLDYNKVNELRKRINEFANLNITDEDLVPNIKVDSIIHNHEVNHTTLDDLEKLEPHGLGNPKPVLIYNGLTIDNIRNLGKEKEHIKLTLHDDKRTFEAIGFRVSDRYSDLRRQDKLDLVMNLSKNSFRGIDTIQFMIKDMRRLEPNYYKNDEIGKCFTKTLAKSLFYNSKGDKLNNIVNFGQEVIYQNDDINRLDYITSNHLKKMLVLVNSFSSLLEIQFRVKDLDLDRSLLGIYYNDLDSSNSNVDILINPIIENIDFAKYDEVVIYDILYNNNNLNVIKSKFVGCIRYLLKLKIDEKSQSELLYTAIPHRLDLIDVYKGIIEEGSLTILIEDYAKKLDMDLIKCDLSVRILEELSLISVEYDSVYHFKVLPKPEKKLVLDQTLIFNQVSKIRNDFYDYIKELKEIIKSS